MKKRMLFLTIIAVLACAWLAVPNATADVIDLGKYDIGPASEANELNYLNNIIIPAYNLANDPDLPLATYGTDNSPTAPGGTNSITLDVSGWSYILLKWGTMSQYYYIEPGTTSFTFDSTVFNTGSGAPLGLSHYTFFGPTAVPDGGLTVMLLGLGVGGLTLFSRKFRQ
jgi:hypothetical protein